MTWFKVSDNFAFHTKALAAGNRALGLWVRAGSYAGQHLTNGHITLGLVVALGGTKKDAQSLVEAGLWEAAPGGWCFHDWADFNPLKEDFNDERDAARERMRKLRTKRGSGEQPPPGDPPQGEVFGDCSPEHPPNVRPVVLANTERTEGGTNGEVPVSRPDPSRTEPDPVPTQVPDRPSSAGPGPWTDPPVAESSSHLTSSDAGARDPAGAVASVPPRGPGGVLDGRGAWPSVEFAEAVQRLVEACPPFVPDTVDVPGEAWRFLVRNQDRWGEVMDVNLAWIGWLDTAIERAERASAVPTFTHQVLKCPIHETQPSGRCRDCEREATPMPANVRAITTRRTKTARKEATQ
jgi:hypothetical protein